jgi:hypothetical protein
MVRRPTIHHSSLIIHHSMRRLEIKKTPNFIFTPRFEAYFQRKGKTTDTLRVLFFNSQRFFSQRAANLEKTDVKRAFVENFYALIGK